MTGTTLASRSPSLPLSLQASSSRSHRQQPYQPSQCPRVVIPSSAPHASGSPLALVREESFDHGSSSWKEGKGKGKSAIRDDRPVETENREPWTISVAAVERFLGRREERKVIFLLGDPTASALHPLLSSPSLAGSLILLASLSTNPVPTAQLLHPMPLSHPTIRTLKPDPKLLNQPEAVRVLHLLERGEKVARAWRKQQAALHRPSYQRQEKQSVFSSNGMAEAQREMDNFSSLSSPGTPPTPDHSRPSSPGLPSVTGGAGGGVFSFTRIARRPSAPSPSASQAPLPKERTFDLLCLFLPAHLLSSAFSISAGMGGSEFELRTHAAHNQLKLAILVSTLSAPFQVGKKDGEPRMETGSEGSSSSSLSRAGSGASSPMETPTEKRPQPGGGVLGILRPKMRKLSSSASVRRPPPIQVHHSTSSSSSSTTSSTTLPNSFAFNLAALPLPAQLVVVLPPSLDKGTQTTLARSLDGFLSSFSSTAGNAPSSSAPDSPGALATRTVHTCLLPLGALSDPVNLPVSSSIRLVPSTQRFSPLELLLADAIRPPAGRKTRWLPSLHEPDTVVLQSHCLTGSSPSSTASSSPSPPWTGLSTASSAGEPPVLSPSHPLSRLTIPIRSHVLHSRAESAGKHRSGHRDRHGKVVERGVLTPPESGSEEGEEGREEVKTPGTAGSGGTVRKRRWGRQY